MSDLYIMFDEAYDVPLTARHSRLIAIAQHYKIPLQMVLDAYGEYIDSDQFYAERGM